MIKKWRNQEEIPIPKTEVEKKKQIYNQVLILRKHIVS